MTKFKENITIKYKNKLGLSCAKLSLASAKLHTSLSSDQLKLATNLLCSTILTKFAEDLMDLKTTIMGGWVVGGWSRITLIIRLSQPQAGDWAWLAWAELGNFL